MSPKFQLGQVVVTPAALRAIAASGQIPHLFLLRHVSGDWGDLESADKAANDRAIAHEGDPDRQDRILSSFQTGNGTKIWVVTAWDRSLTAIILPDEY